MGRGLALSLMIIIKDKANPLPIYLTTWPTEHIISKAMQISLDHHRNKHILSSLKLVSLQNARTHLQKLFLSQSLSFTIIHLFQKHTEKWL